MKILFISGGTDIFLRDIVESLDLKGYDVRVIKSFPQWILYTFKAYRNLKSKLLRLSILDVIATFYKLKDDFSKSLKWADIIWIEWAGNLAAAITRIFEKELLSKKVIIRLHRFEAFTEAIKQINWQVVDKVIFVSNFMFKTTVEINPEISNELMKKGVVIYNGVKLEKSSFKIRTPGFNIGWVAHIFPRKNPMLLLQIAKKILEMDKRYKFYIAGDFPDPMLNQYLKYMVKEMKMEDNVTFCGWVDNIDKFWEDKNYLLSTSIHESFGYAIAEAMVRGVKPIVHNFYDAKELYPEEVIFNTLDEAVEMILSRNYNSKKYREWIISKGFTLDNQIKKIQSLIKSL